MRDDNKPKSNAKKIIKIVLIILYQLLVIMALILTAIIVLQKVSDNNQSIGGYRIFRVVTGSMEPEYEVGEVVISKEVDPKDIQVGDDIVYLGKTGDYAGRIIMHNVIGIDTDENGNLIFHAKGLHSSSVEDPNIREEQIYGVVIYTSDFLTMVYNLATNLYSVFFIIIVLVLNVFVAFNSPKKTKKKRKVKQIANIRDVTEEFDEDIEEDIEEVEDEIEENFEEDFGEDVEEEINNDKEESYDITKKGYIQEEKEENAEDLEKMTHEQRIHEQMKQMLNKDKKINNTKINANANSNSNLNTKTNVNASTKTKKNIHANTKAKKNANTKTNVNTNTKTQEKKGKNRKNK